MAGSDIKYTPTKQQRKAFEFIKEYMSKNEDAPSYREIADHLGLKSVSSVQHIIHGLRERNWIDFKDTLSRSITIIEEEKNESQ